MHLKQTWNFVQVNGKLIVISLSLPPSSFPSPFPLCQRLWPQTEHLSGYHPNSLNHIIIHLAALERALRVISSLFIYAGIKPRKFLSFISAFYNQLLHWTAIFILASLLVNQKSWTSLNDSSSIRTPRRHKSR